MYGPVSKTLYDLGIWEWPHPVGAELEKGTNFGTNMAPLFPIGKDRGGRSSFFTFVKNEDPSTLCPAMAGFLGS
jgi:hypothetical protein